MSQVRIKNDKIKDACDDYLKKNKGSSLEVSIRKLKSKAENNFESSLNLSDHDFLLIQNHL